MNNSKKVKILISLITLFAILCIGIVFIFSTFFRSPKASVIKAVNHTLTKVNTTAPDYLYIKELRSLLADGHYQTTCNLALEDYSNDNIKNTELENFITLAPSISITSHMDYPNKKADSIISFICGGSSLLNLNAYAMDDTIGLECPELYDGCLSFNAATLAEDYNQSYLCTFLNSLMLEQNVNIDLFSTQYSDKSFIDLYSEYYPDDNKALYDAMTVKVSGDTIQVGEHYVSVKGYEIAIPREQMEKAIDNILSLSVHQSESAYQELRYQMEQYLGIITLPDTFICTVYVNPKTNTMLKCVHTSDYLVNGISNAVTVSIEWLGVEYPSDIITATIDVTDAKDSTKSITCDISANTNDTVYEKSIAVSMNTTDKTTGNDNMTATLQYSIDTNSGALTVHSNANKNKSTFVNLDISGAFPNRNVQEGISLDIDHAVFSTSYASTSFSLTGDYSIESLQTEVTKPIETLRPVLEMSEDDFYGFLYEVLRNLSSSPLGSFLKI